MNVQMIYVYDIEILISTIIEAAINQRDDTARTLRHYEFSFLRFLIIGRLTHDDTKCRNIRPSNLHDIHRWLLAGWLAGWLLYSFLYFYIK